MTTTAVRFKDCINACWIGKAVGGTLGMPFEGKLGPHDIWFYSPVPEKMLPNDDLDLQVVWAVVMDLMEKPCVDRHVLAAAWQRHVDFPWDEYGVAKRNIAMGLVPPATGSYDNWFANGMGAAIRTELWACLAPGEAALAASYAYEDACVDHAGEGIWAAMFLAALQSGAFIESDPELLISQALQQIPDNSEVSQAVRNVQEWVKTSDDWMEIRNQILELYDHENFTDVTANIAFIILSWLVGRGDFGRTICIANNCGRDTDCTAATVGALLGIIDPVSIPDHWIAPIGRSLVLSSQIRGLTHPRTLDGLTELILNLQPRLVKRVEPDDKSAFQVQQLEVPARISFMEQMPASVEEFKSSMAADSQEVAFSGSMVSLTRDEFPKPVALIEYRIEVDSEKMVRVMFNTSQRCRAWIDEETAFETTGGTLGPSFHRAGIRSQIKDVQLGRGTHVFYVAVLRDEADGASWIYGVGDPYTCQWLPDLMFHSSLLAID